MSITKTMSEHKFTNNPRSIKRLMAERKKIFDEREDLAKEGLYFQSSEEKIDTYYQFMIIGPPDSCYTGGFYFFDCQYPDSYPFEPMKIKSCTQGGGIRKHPNLYTCGKCCFSFLGTWSGPSWSSLQTSVSVAFSMRSVLTDNPLQNEPSYGNGKLTDQKHLEYSRLVTYFNIRYATIEMLTKPPEKFKGFLPYMETYFVEHYKQYVKQLDSLKGLNSFNSSYNGVPVPFNYDAVKKQLEELYNVIKNRQEV